MIEKVNPDHPDKVADRIAGAIVDLAYDKYVDPRVAVEVLIGHYQCNIIVETNALLLYEELNDIVKRIAGNIAVKTIVVPQNVHLYKNVQAFGDNGIFKGVPLSYEEKSIIYLSHNIYEEFPFDGKYIIDGDKTVICQSNADTEYLKTCYPDAIINPLGNWTGGLDVDTGATNRKLGSDMGQSVTGGGLHGKDLSKADVSVNIYAFLKAQETGKTVELSCAIGDTEIDGLPYHKVVEIARKYIKKQGGFEKFAEWGLLCL